MKNENIRASWSKLTPDSSTKQRMLETIMNGYSGEKQERLSSIGYTRHSLRFAAAAACMAVIVGVGGIVYTANMKHDDLGQLVASSVENVKNSFVITANAQEMEYGAEVVFNELPPAGRGCTAVNDIVEMTGYTALPIRCEGENIESVTYTLKNRVGESFEAFLILEKDYLDITKNDSENYGDMPSYFRFDHAVGTYTVAYEDQPVYDNDGLVQNGDNNDRNKTAPVILQVSYRTSLKSLGFENAKEFNEAMTMYGSSIDSKYTEWYEAMAELYAAEQDKLQIEVIVSYKDGTTQTKTIDLVCKPAVLDYQNGVQYSYMDVHGILGGAETYDLTD